MKPFLISLAAIALLGGSLSTQAYAQPTGQEVRVTLTGVEARGGQILASLQTQDEFMQPRGSYGVKQNAPAANGEITLVFSNVPPGAYSLSVLHDANSDYQMQRDAQGMPLEGWAMSHEENFPSHQAPTFAEASFSVGDHAVTLTEAMKYPAAAH